MDKNILKVIVIIMKKAVDGFSMMRMGKFMKRENINFE